MVGSVKLASFRPDKSTKKKNVEQHRISRSFRVKCEINPVSSALQRC